MHSYGRLSNVEALLGEMETVFPPRGAFHLDYMLFGAASGCMGFDREAFALMLDQVWVVFCVRWFYVPGACFFFLCVFCVFWSTAGVRGEVRTI